jgi:hypothetical protein
MDMYHARTIARNNFSVCSHCGAEFKPLRRSARFCGPTCRKAANRKLCHANVTTDGPSEAARTSQNGSRVHAGRSGQINAATTAKLLSVTRGFAIVPDARWPGMYRIRRPDGTLTEMVNLTRAKDALRALEEGAP